MPAQYVITHAHAMHAQQGAKTCIVGQFDSLFVGVFVQLGSSWGFIQLGEDSSCQ